MKKVLMLASLATIVVAGSSCVAKKKFVEAENQISNLQRQKTGLQEDIENLKSRLQLMEEANQDAANQIGMKDSLLTQKDNLLTMKDGELMTKEQRMQEMQTIIERQKKQTQELYNKMLNALGGFKSDELTVYTKNGKVYVSMSEKLLFPSGSAVVNKDGKEALAKIAQALNENMDINVNVEGHTDSIPIKVRFEDNWALSVARSNSIIRILIKDYQVDAERLTASGRAEFEPVASNADAEGRAKNRRTEIVLAPKLDELMNLMKVD